MIKCFGSGKLLKLLSSILLIGFFGLGVNSFVNASCYPYDSSVYIKSIHPVGGTFTSSNNNAFDIGILSKGTVFSQNLGFGKKVFAPTQNNLIFWDSNGLPYIYYNDSFQGNPQYYFVCPEITADTPMDSNLTNCSLNTLSADSVSTIGSFMSSVKVNDDYWAYYLNSDSYYNYFNLCISNHSLERSMCFVFYTCSYNSSCHSGNCPLINSLGLSNITFDNIPNSIIGESPGVSGVSGGGSISGDLNNTISGDYYYSNCTYQQIFDYAESNGYSDYLCYGGLNNFDLYDSTLNYDPIPGTGKTLGQILAYSNSWDTPQDRFTFWNGLYLDRYNNTYNAMWESYPAVYRSWFDLYYRFGGSSLIFDSVREYCAMKMLDIDFNTTFYKGQYFKNTCSYIKNGGQYPGGGSGTGESNNAVGVNWIGVGSIGSGDDVVVSSDPTKFIQDFFNKLKENLPTRYDLGGGFLPLYIITFMCAIILFRFLSH